MSTDIVITEKNSQARDVRAALGNRYGAILPAEGHLITLLEPEEVNPDWKRWSAVLLRPDGLYGTKPASGGNKAAKIRSRNRSAVPASNAPGDRLRPRGTVDRSGNPRALPFSGRGHAGHVHRPRSKDDPRRLRRRETERRVSEPPRAAVARQQSDQIYITCPSPTATCFWAVASARSSASAVEDADLAIVCDGNWKSGCSGCKRILRWLRSRASVARSLMRHAPPRKSSNTRTRCRSRGRVGGFTGPLSVKVEEKRQAATAARPVHAAEALQPRFG